MMFEEYILLIIENQMIAQLDESLKLGLKRHLKNTGIINVLNHYNILLNHLNMKVE